MSGEKLYQIILRQGLAAILVACCAVVVVMMQFDRIDDLKEQLIRKEEENTGCWLELGGCRVKYDACRDEKESLLLDHLKMFPPDEE